MGTSLQFPEVSRCAVCSLVASVEEARMKLSFPNYKLGSSICFGQQTGVGQTYQMGVGAGAGAGAGAGEGARSERSSCEQSPLLSS